MAQIINTNIMSLNAQRNLNTSGTALATSIQRLSSGLRINSAKDDAAGLAISERFTTQIRGMNQAARNANDGISLAQTAEGALGEIGNNLQRIRELAVQSRNATNSAGDRAALDAEVQLLKAEIQRVAEETNFNGTPLLNGSFMNQAFQVGADQGQVINIAQIANANIKSLGNWNRVDTPATVAAVSPQATITSRTVTGAALAAGGPTAMPTVTATAGTAAGTPASPTAGSTTFAVSASDLLADFTSTSTTLNVALDGATTPIAVALNGNYSGGSGGDDLALAITTALGGAGTAAYVAGTGITITSATLGANSAVTISGALAPTPTSTTQGQDAGAAATQGSASFNASTLLANFSTNNASFAVTIDGGTPVSVALNADYSGTGGGAALATAITTALGSTGTAAYDAVSGNITVTSGGTAGTSSSVAVGALTTTPIGATAAGEFTINGVSINGAGGATASAGVDALVTAFNTAKGANPTELGSITASNVNGRLQLVDSTGAAVTIGGTATGKAGMAAATDVPVQNFGAGSLVLTGSKGTATINFPAAGGAGQRASDLVKAINNQSYNTGVSASLDAAGKLQLTSLSGNFSVAPAGTGTAADLLANTGLTEGLTGAMDPALPPAVTVGTSWEAGAAETGFADLDVASALGADNALAAMDAALQAINSARADLGAVQNRFTSTIANLTTSSENLTAARSRIRDTDYAVETAELTRTQILQQAGTAMLAQANQVPQSVLSLLK